MHLTGATEAGCHSCCWSELRQSGHSILSNKPVQQLNTPASPVLARQDTMMGAKSAWKKTSSTEMAINYTELRGSFPMQQAIRPLTGKSMLT